MTPYHVSRHIAAPPSTVWSILTNAETLSDGRFSIIKIEGQIAKGQRIKLWSDVDPQRAFPIKVAVVETDHRMEWHGGMPLGLFRGNRQFILTAKGNETMFEMQETYSGPLKGMITRFIPDLQPSFEIFADGVKAAAEGVT